MNLKVSLFTTSFVICRGRWKRLIELKVTNVDLLDIVVMCFGGNLMNGTVEKTVVDSLVEPDCSQIAVGKNGIYGAGDVRKVRGISGVVERLQHRSVDDRARVFGPLTMHGDSEAMDGRRLQAD